MSVYPDQVQTVFCLVYRALPFLRPMPDPVLNTLMLPTLMRRITNAFTEIEQYDLLVDSVTMSTRTFVNFLHDSQPNRQYVDPESHGYSDRTGIAGHLFRATVLVHPNFPPNIMVFSAPPEFTVNTMTKHMVLLSV